MFETTIRYVGGFLSAYELNGRKDAILLEKATQVADKLAFAWVGDNQIPFGELNFTTNQPVIETVSRWVSNSVLMDLLIPILHSTVEHCRSWHAHTRMGPSQSTHGE